MSSVQESFGKLFKSASIVFLGTIAARGLALGAEVAMIRSLTPSTFGVIAVAYTVSLILARLSLLGVPQGVTRFSSDGTSERGYASIAQDGLILVIPVALLAGASVVVFRQLIETAINSEGMATYLVYFAAFVVIFPISKVVIAVLRAHGRTGPAVLSKDLVPRVLGLGLFAGFATVGAAESGVVAYWVSLPIVSLGLAIYYLRGIFDISDLVTSTVDRAEVRRLWSFSWPLAFSASLILFFSNMDILMIEYFMASEEAGYYRSVQPLRQVTEFVLSSFIFLYMPLATQHFSEGNLGALDDFYKTATKWITALTLPMVLVFAVFAEEVVRTFYGVEYLPAAGALAVLVSGLFFNVLVGPNGATAKAIDRPRIDLVSAAVGFVINLVLNVLLIPRFGIVGAAFATVCGYITFNTVEVVLIYRAVGAHPFSANQLKPLVPTTLVALGLERTVGEPITLPGLIGIGIVLSVVHLGSMLLTRSFDENDVNLIRQVEQRTGRRLPYARRLISRYSD